MTRVSRANLFWFAVFCVLAALVLTTERTPSPALREALAPARLFYSEHPFESLALFWATHLIASAFSLPGSCTFLNILAGAVFGFWTACAAIYPVTLLSAAASYAFARSLRDRERFRAYEPQMNSFRDRLAAQDYWFFVSARLNPLIPFGLLNLIFGFLRVPFSFFMATTAVGIFFDVTVLASVGAALEKL